jgi:DNA-damage-inducible protein D
VSTKKDGPNDVATRMVVFQERAIRRTWHNSEWWFAIVDVVVVLTDSVQPEGYVKDLRRRDKELAKGWGQIATPLRVQTEGGAQRVNCANTEGLFRIIQSIPSPKAEPFKRWLAQVGYERVQEIENPELATARARSLHQAKGYPKDWIEKRLRSNSPMNGRHAVCRRARGTPSSRPRSPAPLSA